MAFCPNVPVNDTTGEVMGSMVQGNGRDWKRLLEEVMTETDEDEIRNKLLHLEYAIFNRGMELERSADGDAERQAMRDAAVDLLYIKVQKLRFPLDPKVLSDTRRTG
jgi:hypothetical protein